MNRTPIQTCLFSLLPAFLLAGVFCVPGLRAQELPWLPGGKVRLDFAPRFWTWDTRYGVDAAGASVVEPLGSDLTSETLGSGVLPDLKELEASLASALNEDAYRVRLGASEAVIDQSRLVFPLRLEVGVTDWLTLGAMVPFHRPRTEMEFTLTTGEDLTNVGLSPQTTSASQVNSFLVTFASVLEEAREDHAGNSDLQKAQAFLDALAAAYAQKNFFPAFGTPASAALQERLARIRDSLGALGISGLPENVPVAGTLLTEEEFEAFLGGNVMRAQPLEDLTTPWKMGDVEITTAMRILHHGFEPDSAGELPRLRYQLGAGFVLRLGTGTQANFNRLFELNPADGQTDLEGSLFGLVEWGNRLGAWGQVRYGIQTEGEITKRITPPDAVLPDWGRTAPLLWTPGNYLELELSPRFFLTPQMSIGVRYHLWNKGEDSYALQPLDPEVLERTDYPPADLLNQETKETLRELGFGVTYSTVEANERGEASLPIFFRATYFHPVGGSGGRTPKGGRFEAGISLFRTFWGGGSDSEDIPGETEDVGSF